MKKIMGMAVAVLVTLTALVGCASNKGEYGGVADAHKEGRPGWAQRASGVSFREHEISRYDAPNPNENGLFVAGFGDRGNIRSSTVTARLNARSEMAATVAAQLRREAGDSDEAVTQFTQESVDSTLVGSRIVDTISDTETGEVWVLMFISKNDLKNSYKNKPQEDTMNSLIETWWGTVDVTSER